MKHIKHLFAVCLLLLVATTATAQSQSDNTQTKAVSATKADVNGDGVVNEADIEEILAIMQQENGTKYYWYVGQDNPAVLPENFNPEDQEVTDNSSPGWRYIGTSVPTYSASNMLYNPNVSTIVTGTTLQYNYIAIPSKSSAIMRDGAGNPGTSVNLCTLIGTKTIENVEYNIYKTNSKAKKLGYPIY
jgi:hypothetical protein